MCLCIKSVAKGDAQEGTAEPKAQPSLPLSKDVTFFSFFLICIFYKDYTVRNITIQERSSEYTY